MKKIEIILSLCIAILFTNYQVSAQKEFKKSYSAKEAFKISTVSGNCTIKKSDNNQINVQLTYTYSDDCFRYTIDESSNKLSIKEEFDGSCSGESDWTISIPENTTVKFNSASGDFAINGVRNGLKANTASGNMKIEDVVGEIDINTASGDLELFNVQGDLSINTASGKMKLASLSAKSKITTASGDIIIKNSTRDLEISVASGSVNIQSSKSNIKVSVASGDVTLSTFIGSLELNAASGNIDAEDVELSGESSFNAASGDISVKLAKTAENDITLSTASGNVNLDYNGNEIKGYFEFTARQDKGKIVSPIKFDKEEVIMIGGKEYDKKTFTKGSSNPKIILKTSSGTAQLSK